MFQHQTANKKNPKCIALGCCWWWFNLVILKAISFWRGGFAHDFCMFGLAALFPISKHSAILNMYMFRDLLVTGMFMQRISGSHKLMPAHNTPCRHAL